MQRTPLLVGSAFVAVVLLAACGGGGSGSSTPPAPISTPAPTAAPTTAATNPPSMPTAATIGGQSLWVGQNGFTLYQFSIDGNDVSNCTSSNGCTAIWPPYAAPAGTVAPAGTPFSVFTRGDGTMQWAVNGHPLYDYSGDTAAGQTNGEGIVGFGGSWTDVSTTASAPSPTTAPTSSSSPAPTASPYATHTHRP